MGKALPTLKILKCFIFTKLSCCPLKTHSIFRDYHVN